MSQEPKLKKAVKGKTNLRPETKREQVTINEDSVRCIIEAVSRTAAAIDEAFPGRIVRINPSRMSSRDGLTQRGKNLLRGIRDAQLLGTETVSFIMAAILAGQAWGGLFWQLRADLRKDGWIEYVGKSALKLTTKAKERFPVPKKALDYAEYLARVERCVTSVRFRVVKRLVERNGEWIGRAELAKKSEFSRGSDKFASILTYLHRLELLEYGPKQTCRATGRLLMKEIR